ncbi:hypothetical protein BO71DRAFT_419373 [Aspergillus ellipticus CBS 707.79]|uniref:5-oxoprolinase n=1 Tax=Aspergillus ellipticus CBS 707.79 TaxID=1448320 RepID=A0A319DSV5_9EURO|nr:hypothetical protein BO71DRAFT_419373 [Aspergillus ellipticus CBS 707.79]
MPLMTRPGVGNVKIAINRGGTFTDVWASLLGKPDIVIKLLSVDPSNYDDAPTEGIRRVLSHYYGEEIPRGTPLPKGNLDFIRMGTTVATNALLERKVTTTALFDLDIMKPAALYDEVREIDARVTIEGFDEEIDGVLKCDEEIPGVLVRGTSGDMVRILKPLDEEQVRQTLKDVRLRGINTIAVCFTHSSMEEGFTHVSLSSAVATNTIKMMGRGNSASANAYLTPEIRTYLKGFIQGFENGNLDGVQCDFMQSDGGLVKHDYFSGLRGILSGPAGGVIGYANTAYNEVSPVVGLDMGGTSTDVSRYEGYLEYIFENTTAGVTIQSPQLNIKAVATGGSSILRWKNGLFTVGPDSASSHPGPACYRKGGPLTVTYANLLLGRLIPDYFPMIFGRAGRQALDTIVVKKKFSSLTATINAETGKSMSPEEVACGFLDVANEAICRPIQSLIEGKGYDIGKHNHSVFGGVRGQHACDIARELGVPTIIIHKYSRSRLVCRLLILQDKVCEQLDEQSRFEDNVRYQRYLNMRYQGTETAIMVLEPANGDFKAEFKNMHLQEFGFLFPDNRAILVDDIRVRGIGLSGGFGVSGGHRLGDEWGNSTFTAVTSDMAEGATRKLYFQGLEICTAPVFLLHKLAPLTFIVGPAIIIDNTQTLVITPGAEARILKQHIDSRMVDNVHISVFGRRFMSIAEQMGHILQKKAVSLNLKKRLDFSCDLFDPEGMNVIPDFEIELIRRLIAAIRQKRFYGVYCRPNKYKV